MPYSDSDSDTEQAVPSHAVALAAAASVVAPLMANSVNPVPFFSSPSFVSTAEPYSSSDSKKKAEYPHPAVYAPVVHSVPVAPRAQSPSIRVVAPVAYPSHAVLPTSSSQAFTPVPMVTKSGTTP